VDGGHATEAEITHAFDIQAVTNVGTSTMVNVQDLSLEQNTMYFVYVMGMYILPITLVSMITLILFAFFYSKFFLSLLKCSPVCIQNLNFLFSFCILIIIIQLHNSVNVFYVYLLSVDLLI